jgi:cell wall-associated NlpC family hydrolase
MKRKAKRIFSSILVLALSLSAVRPAADNVLVASATSITSVQNQITATQNELDSLYSKIDSLSDQQDLVQEKIDDLNAEIINAMASISMKEDEISEKEDEITDKNAEIDQKEAEYEEAKIKAKKQYDDMVTQVRFMYEQGDISYAGLLFGGNGLSDALNNMDYVESVYEYSRGRLDAFEAARDEVLELWNQLEDEKNQLEEDKQKLEDDKVYLQGLKASLDSSLAKKKQESDNYEAEIKKARQDAAVAKTKLQQEQQELKRLQAAAASTSKGTGGTTTSAGVTTAAATATYATTDYTNVIDNASGSDLGKKIAKYACQFIGNPYVAGGTSLTNGADCSGFTYAVYRDFGYSLPRTSYEQRSAGTSVSYSEAQPGDLICYDGHVAMYIGGGLIVHASTAKTGIKVSYATYREILSVRRII